MAPEPMERNSPIPAPAVRAAQEVARREGYLRERLAERLLNLTRFWLVAASVDGDLAYVAGSTRDRGSGELRAAIVEISRHANGTVAVSAIAIDPRSGYGCSPELRCRLGAQRDPELDPVNLALLACILEPEDARRAGSAAYQEIAAGKPLDLFG